MSINLNQSVYTERLTQYPGYYEIKKLEITSTFGKKKDVSPFMSELNIYEDLMSPTLTGSLVLVDPENLIKNLPIIGEETLTVKVSDQYAEVDKEFVIYKISDRSQPNFGLLTYTLHFCSRELYLNAFVRVSKAYQKTRFEDAVEDVTRFYLKSDKNLRMGSTKIPQSFIIPNWSPFFGINWMASRSQDPNYIGGNFLFFEDLDGFNFVAVENLLDSERNKPFATVSLDPMRVSENDSISYDERQKRDVMRFESLEVVKSLDVLENMTFGMYKNMVRIVDVGVRGSETKTYDYQEEFNNSIHLDGWDPQSKKVPAYPLSSGNNPNVLYDIGMENNVFVKAKGLFSDEPDGGFQIEDWFSPRLSQMHQMNNFVIKGILPGQMEMRVGMILKFRMPSPEHLDSPGASVPVDEAYSGNYLVTSIRRMFQKNKFYCVIEMIKDSMGTDIESRQ